MQEIKSQNESSVNKYYYETLINYDNRNDNDEINNFSDTVISKGAQKSTSAFTVTNISPSTNFLKLNL